MYKLALSLVFQLSLGSIAFSQIYFEGEFDIKRTYKFSGSIQNDTSKMERITNNPLYFIPSKVIFNQDKIAVIYKHRDKIYERIVYDYENKKIFTFKYPQYHPENSSFHECFTARNKLGINNFEIKKLEFPKNVVLGKKSGNNRIPIISKDTVNNFDCNVYVTNENVTLWYTNDLALPYLNYSKYSALNLDDSLFCVKSFDREKDIEIIYEIIDFHPNIQNLDLLQTDTMKFKSKQYVDKIYQKLCDSLKSNRTYQYVNNGGENADKVVNLLNRGLYFESEYERLKGKNYDFYNLINVALIHFNSTNYDSLNLIFLQDNVITEEEYLLLNEYYKKCMIHSLDYRELIKIYAINKILKQKHSKNLLLKGLKKLPLNVDSKFISSNEEYYNGIIDFSTLLFSYEEINPLTIPKILVTKNDLTLFVKSFIAQFFNEFTVGVNANRVGFDVIVNNSSYSFHFDEFLNYDANKLDTFYLEHHHYNSILNRVKQIAVDNSIEYAYAINSFIELFDNNISTFSYEQITKHFPDLVLFSDLYYTIKFKKSQYDFMNTINLSFSESNRGIDGQLYLKSLFVGDVDAEVKYISTEKKIKLSKLINLYKKEIGINNKQFQKFNEYLYSNLYADLPSILNLLPINKFSTSRIMNDFPSIQSGKSLKENFPSLFLFLGGKVNGNNFQELEASPYFLTFQYKGRTVGIKHDTGSKWKSVLKVMDIIMNKDQNKSIYMFTPTASFSSNYYLIHNELALDLLNLFGEYSFNKID